MLADELDNPPVPSVVKDLVSGSRSRVRVALVDSGVNYLLPRINAFLARDSSGEIIGYDFWDMDSRPFDSHPVGAARGAGNARHVQRHGTRTAAIIQREAPFAELVAYRYPRPDMQRMVELVAHASAHDVRVVGLPLGGNRPDQWGAFEQAAKQHPDILFIASAGNNARDIDEQPVYPASLPLDNLLVVTSADDFGRVAQGVNWGRVAVDYMVPAENVRTLSFDGAEIHVAGSSYAVPRVVALAARLLGEAPDLDTAALLGSIRQSFANGAAPRQLAQGYLHDPQWSISQGIEIVDTRQYGALKDVSSDVSTQLLTQKNSSDKARTGLSLQVLLLDPAWKTAEVLAILSEAEQILGQCGLAFVETQLQRVQSPDYMRDLETGRSRTLMDAVRLSGPARKLTVVFARDTLMRTPFDAEAFGRGNTRHRPWLTDSVWLTLALQDRAIALAHELFHVLVNSGEHSTAEGSLMLARTTGDNRGLSDYECKLAVERSQALGLVQPQSD